MICSKDWITVYRLKHSGMHGSKGCYETAYTDEQVAKMVADEMKGEWEDWKVEKCEDAERLPENRCLVGREMYKLDESAARDKHRANALKKLSKEEREALLGPERNG